MKKGEIWIIHVPALGGHTQQGTRLAIVLADPKLSVVTIIPCTSNIQALRFPHTIRIEPSARNGLNSVSVALVFQPLAIDRRFFQEKVGILEKSLISVLDKELRSLLDM